MSNYIYPTFQGLSCNKEKNPLWKTNVYEAASGKENRIQKWSYPRYKITLNYNFMTDNALQSVTLEKGDIEKLQGFFNKVGGNCDDFLYYDDVENYCENQVFGTGDATTKVFQLKRSLPNWVEPVKGIIDAPVIKIAGTTIASNLYEWDNNGKITFDTAPTVGAELTWTGHYYFRVRFQNEQIELTQTFDGLYEEIEINLITVK